jgi:hypothetical protein
VSAAAGCEDQVKPTQSITQGPQTQGRRERDSRGWLHTCSGVQNRQKAHGRGPPAYANPRYSIPHTQCMHNTQHTHSTHTAQHRHTHPYLTSITPHTMHTMYIQHTLKSCTHTHTPHIHTHSTHITHTHITTYMNTLPRPGPQTSCGQVSPQSAEG